MDKDTNTPDEHSVTVAVVDDNKRVVDTITAFLNHIQCNVRGYTNASACLDDLATHPSDIVVTDIRMPGMDGISLLRKIKETYPETDVITVSGNAEKSDAIHALKLGAFDFFEKPVDGDELIETIKRTVRYRSLLRERNQYAEQLSFLSRREARKWGIKAFVGKAPEIKKCIKEIRLLQRADRTSVLVTGESGTGKELVARAIHFGGPRSARPFVPVNCSAVPKELAESTLFGHTRGSFTGATADRKGCFKMADGGTLFLDEIGDMPADMQTKLLRVLEDGIVTPVGGASGSHVDVRVVAATNANLHARIASGSFRTDLYYRLGSFQINVPPLRDRREDIPQLADHFLSTISEEMGLPNPGVTPETLSVLQNHGYPGNVRELKNILERALIESGGREIVPSHIHLQKVGEIAAPAASLHATDTSLKIDEAETPLNLQQMESMVVRRAMHAADGNVSAAARLLGISRPKLYRKLAAIPDSQQ
ncbi:MAG: sigma-54 dependent transcriptional regulator [Kiritimatiellia bacterium]|jgi:DNA-binding NtrC family response regulator|nr:sigma-54 dependent transcriptional regulator [Kiritimatiellia bacterium]MDP6847932.1 sigma-54 dependent transcriptional regulator [Kiritimatiellia bacterium]